MSGNDQLQEFAPLSDKGRIDYMDLIRGLAIFGILIANLRWFSLYSPDVNGSLHFPGVDETIRLLQHVLIEGKFYSIFSLLFGWGIALQISRSKKGDSATSKLIRRRLWFMLLLGGLHLFFIWEGDIVFIYGLTGFVLVALRKYSNRVLLVLGVLFLLSPILLYYLKMTFSWFSLPSKLLYQAGEAAYQLNGWVDQDTSRTDVLRTSEHLLPIFKITLADAPYRFAYLFFVSRFPKVLGAMLIGFVIGKTGFYSKLITRRKLMCWISILGLLLLIPLNFILVHYVQNEHAYYNLEVQGLYFTIMYALTVFPLALVYMLAIALLFEIPVFRKLFKPVLAVGKTAFSNYIMHSLVGIVVFYGIGFGLVGEFGPLAWTLFAVVFFIAQVIISNVWLRFFRFGPIEWIWRSLTHRKLQTIRNK